jgi:hypothetical protein
VNDRVESALPNVVESKADSTSPKTPAPAMESADAKRATLRSDKLFPRTAKSNTDSDEPSLAMP